MSVSTRRTVVTIASRRRAIGRVAVTVLAAALTSALATAMAGCSVVQSVSNVGRAISANRAVISTFVSQLKSGKAVPFQATYVTTGSSPTTVIYAAQPPKEVAFKEISGGNGSTGTPTVDLISNATGEFSCSTATGSSGWQCAKLGKANANAQNQIIDFYTPSHWVTFLEVLSVGAGLAGEKVTTSTMTVNGIPLNCIDFGAHQQSRSTVCSTSAGILGYVKVATNPTSFEIKSYTTSPPASDFQLPPGAKVTKG